MRLLQHLVLFLASATLALCDSSLTTESTTIYIETVGPSSSASSSVVPLAEISYNPSTLAAELTSYEAPELPSVAGDADGALLRLGVWDPAAGAWRSAVSVTAAESFARGFAPTLVLSLDAQGGVLGVSCRAGRVDAGQTRDFGPKVKIVRTGAARKPDLNRPVVLSPEGKVEVPVPEKTLLQKYWWVLLGVVVLALAGPGDK